jgi:hypothetical protein
MWGRTAVDVSRETEAQVYQQKRAHKAWLGEVGKRGEKPSTMADGLVWELLLSYGEALVDLEEARDDIYKTAYEIASLAVPHLNIRRLTELYRDCLLDAIMDTSEPYQDSRPLVHFANLISTAFIEARTDMLKRTIRHTRTESLSNELRVAKSIQSYLLPKVIPQIPGFEFAGRLVPAMEVGGDYWSVKHYPEDGVVTLKLADITGHGVAAATLVAAVKFISGGYYRGSKSASEVMQRTNHVLVKETPHDIMVAMVYGWLRPESRRLTIVNAGHEPVFLYRGGLCMDFPPTGPVLGVTEADYGEIDIQLETGDVVFFGSDGIIEAGITEQFGMERLKELVINSSHLSADELADKVVRTVIDFAEQPHDDISLLVVKVRE